MSNAPTWLNVRDLCARFQLSRASVYVLIARGQLPRPTKIGRSARWRDSEIAAAEDRIVAAQRDRGAP